MIFEEKEIALKNGKRVIFKSPCADDAEKMLDFLKKASAETDFLLCYPEEWTLSADEEKKLLNQFRASFDNMMITCYSDGEVVGNANITVGRGAKTSHRATVAIAILKDYWNVGIGSAIFEELIAVAKKRTVEILELEFIEGNERARKLYEKFGFKIVSEKPNAIKLKDGTYLKEIYMQKYL